MKLEHVKLAPGNFFFEVGVVVCLDCGVPLTCAEAYADLDGPTQRWFYCGRCVGRFSPRAGRSQSVSPPCGTLGRQLAVRVDRPGNSTNVRVA